MKYDKKPLVVEWNLTYQCNLNCLHCSASEMRDVRENLTLEDFEAAMRELSSYQCTLHINPNAGEPTIREGFVEVYNLMAQNLDNVRLTTNGTTMSRIVDRMCLRNLSTIILSLDGGSKEVHDKIRGNDTYEKTCRSLETLHRKKEKENLYFDTQINYVINKLNSESLRDMVTVLDEYDVAVINVIHTDSNTGNAKIHADMLHLPYEECINSLGVFLYKLQTINKTRREKSKKPILLRPESFSAKWLYVLTKKYGLKDLLFEKRSTCNVLTGKYIHIDPQGNAFPCFIFTREELQRVMTERYSTRDWPNILKDTVEGILASNQFENARDIVRESLGFNGLPCECCRFLNGCSICPVYARLWGVENDCF